MYNETQPTLFDLPQAENKPDTKNYYNTSNAKGNDLKERILRATKQDDKILVMFSRFKNLSAYTILGMYEHATGGKILITSVRRSLNTLEKQNKIVNTKVKRDTPVGGSENIYKIITN